MSATTPNGCRHDRLVTTADWDAKWANIFDQYQQDLRHAYYIRALKNRNEHSILELGAGSFRDMAALRRWGVKCQGTDFSPASVQMAKTRFPEYADAIFEMDGFNLRFPDKSFDLTYHNGFWVLFPDDQIDLLAREQARITKHRMIASVHNAHNQQFKEYFERKQKDDNLYNIRFFEVDQMKKIMGKVCSKVTIVPVGKGKKNHEDRLIRRGFGQPVVLRTYFKLSGMRLLSQSERLLCIGTI